jgi:hypothetical protein
MNTETIRHKPLTCPHCKTEQRIHLLAIPDKPAVLIPKQTVRCVGCDRGFFLFNEAKIVGGPFVM